MKTVETVAMISVNPDVSSELAVVEPSAEASNIFPLPLSPFEQYMFTDDRDDYPMVIVLMAELEGTLIREAFEKSLRLALLRHPLLSSLVRHVPGRGPCWVPATDCELDFTWNECVDSLPNTHQERIDVTERPGLRIQANILPERSRVDFHFHHACVDGIGGIQFIGDVLAFYGRLTAASGAELPELTPVIHERLLSRMNYAIDEATKETKAFGCPWRLGKKLLKLLRRGPMPLAIHQHQRPTKAEARRAPALRNRSLDRGTVQKLKVVAAQKGVGLNDLCLAGLFHVMAEWNREHQKTTAGRWLRIGMPTSLRTPSHDGMPAANIVSFMFLTRSIADCQTPEKILADIHRQTSAIVNDRQGRFFVNGLRHVLRIPGLLKGLLTFNSCFATAILSNVGDTRRQFTAQFPLKQGRCVAGNVVLMGIKGAAPIRANTRVSVTIGLHAGNLNMNIHCDPNTFTNELAEAFADRFVNRIKEFVAVDVEIDSDAA